MQASEIAIHVGKHRNTVLAWARADLIPVRRRNKRILIFDLEAVKAAMQKNGLKSDSLFKIHPITP